MQSRALRPDRVTKGNNERRSSRDLARQWRQTPVLTHELRRPWRSSRQPISKTSAALAFRPGTSFGRPMARTFTSAGERHDFDDRESAFARSREPYRPQEIPIEEEAHAFNLKLKQLTRGEWEVRRAELSPDGSTWHLTTSKEHPGENSSAKRICGAGGSVPVRARWES